MTDPVSTPISVEEAIRRVLEHSESLQPQMKTLSSEILGCCLAQDIVATKPFPSFPASIMDGYAVHGPLEPGYYKISQNILAGITPNELADKNQVVYITTGSMVPNGANAVIKVEDTEKIDIDTVHIKTKVEAGSHIREVGSDIALGEVILRQGDRLGPSELGLLATTGYTEVLCYVKPVLGVLSTGDELVEAWENPVGSQIRDSNRISLISAFIEEGFVSVVDLGIVRDTKEKLKEKLLEASTNCDIVVTSGGVSMGAADFVKPLLKEIGSIHFGKLNMKPGKPTTFATYRRKSPNGKSKNTLFFGLPGNPVSCLVTKALFVDVAIKRLQGQDSEKCLHPQLSVELVGGSIKLDPERPEYHRARISVEPIVPSSLSDLNSSAQTNTRIVARSTGFQRSSRLLSMKSSNGLLFLPKGPGIIPEGSVLNALLIRDLEPAQRSISVHPLASNLDFDDAYSDPDSQPLKENSMGYESFSSLSKQLEVTKIQSSSLKDEKESASTSKKTKKIVVKAGLLTISDRAYNGVYKDESGPEMAKLLNQMNDSPDFPLTIEISCTAVVPDNSDMISSTIQYWTELNSQVHVDLVLTSGGTGFGPRDNTPETIRPLLHREAPGIAQALLNEGLKHTPLAVMSRPVAGTRNRSFICTLPGSVKAVRENIVCLKVLFPRIFELLKEGECAHP